MPPALVGRSPARALASRRAATMSPGMNLPGWFWPSDDAGSEPGTAYTVADLARYRALGMRGVRIPTDHRLMSAPGSDHQLDVGHVDLLVDRIGACLDAGLNVVVNVHNGVPEDAEGGLSSRLQHDEVFRASFVAFWRRLAALLAHLPADRVIIEPVNEPVFTDPDSAPVLWTHGVAPALVSAIRSDAPEHTILVAGQNAAAASDLHRLDPAAIGDDNVVYSVHMYEPYPFTHQRASWAPPAIAALRNVRYPSDHGATNVVETELDVAIDWSAAHDVPMLVSEFGAYRASPSPDRERWTRDVRTHLERRRVPWMAWTDRSGFGFEDANGVFDREMLSALGLHDVGTPHDAPC